MMQDIAQRVQTIVVLFKMALACRRQLMAMINAIQAAHIGATRSNLLNVDVWYGTVN